MVKRSMIIICYVYHSNILFINIFFIKYLLQLTVKPFKTRKRSISNIKYSVKT